MVAILCVARALTMTDASFRPVSYTPLDVYKRQVIMLLRGYLQGQAVADVAGEADVQACTLEDVINERGGCRGV